jgi:predicted DsbA family dithiol-disulfide isomerase
MTTPTTTPTPPAAPALLHIDFVSDVACPWCAVGLWALERALDQLQGQVLATIHPQPFELNPHMGAEGEDIGEHLGRKYGSTPAQQAQIRETIRQRGAQEGFVFKAEGRGRIWNTFDAHRLLHWASVEGAPGDALALKKALLTSYQGRAENPSDPAVLLAVVEALDRAALPVQRARAVLAAGEFAQDVREQQAHFQALGIRSVPAVIINHRHLISGGQPAEVFVQALRQLAAHG